MQTVRQLSHYIDREGTIRADGFDVRIRIADARSSYGRAQILARPLTGGPSRWIDAERFRPDGAYGARLAAGLHKAFASMVPEVAR